MKNLLFCLLFLNFLFVSTQSLWAGGPRELQEALAEVTDFSKYTARPIRTESREEVFELLKKDFKELICYHLDLAKFYGGFLKLDEDNLRTFFQERGYLLPFTECKKILTGTIDFHDARAQTWGARLSSLIGEPVKISENIFMKSPRFLSPTPPACDLMTGVFQEDFNTLCMDGIGRRSFSVLAKDICVKSICDELWALRYAIALLSPWTSSQGNKPPALSEKTEAPFLAGQLSLDNLKKTHASKLMSVLEGQETRFEDFISVFTCGLGGVVYQNKGGWVKIFVLREHTFFLYTLSLREEETARFNPEIRVLSMLETIFRDSRENIKKKLKVVLDKSSA